MKTLALSLYNALLLFILFLLFQTKIDSQWLPDQRLTFEPGSSRTSTSSQRNIASNGLTLHVVWEDSRAGNYEIYYKRSTDAGITWDADKRLTQDTSFSEYPCIAVSGEFVHVVWYDKRIGNYEIYYKRSTNAGLTWEQDKRISFGFTGAWHPNIAALGSEVHIVWDMLIGYNNEIHYIRSTNNGTNWGSVTRLTHFDYNSIAPSVSANDSNVHVAWHDDRNGSPEIYYKRSIDNGINWSNDLRLTNDSATSMSASITSSGSNVHIVWFSDRPFRCLYYIHSTDNGINWDNDRLLTSDSASPLTPSIISSGQNLHLFWYDIRFHNNDEIYYLYSTNSGLNWSNENRITFSNGTSQTPSSAVTNSSLHVVWEDYRDGNSEIYYKRNPTGNPIGIISISNEIPKHFLLEQNYPNPFNPSTKIRFSIPAQNYYNENVKLVIFNVLGSEVKTLLNEIVDAGIYEIDFDANELASGIYYYRLIAGSFSDTKKMIIIK